MIKAIVIEDEKLAADKLVRLLKKVEYPVKVIKRLTSLAESVSFLSFYSDSVDLIFLDVHLGDGNCFELFDRIEVNQPIIFTTAYDQYTLPAFKTFSIDYLLKPINQADLEAALLKFNKVTQQSTLDYSTLLEQLGKISPAKNRFIVNAGAKIRSVEIAEVAYFYAEQGHTFLTTLDGKTYDINYTLDKLLPTLPTEDFFRVNRKVIVNFQAILEAYQFSKRKLSLRLKPTAHFEAFVPADKIVAFKAWLGH